MRAAEPSLTKFWLVLICAALMTELIGRTLFSLLGEEPWYDRHRQLVKGVPLALIVIWAGRHFRIGERLRRRGHIR